MKYAPYFLFVASVLFVTLNLLIANSHSNGIVFTLSAEKVRNLMSYDKPTCQEVINCTLEPGDILIRRYLTSRTNMLSIIFGMYFTHSAIYLGGGKIVEAIGIEPNRENDITIDELNNSDWTKDPLESLVVFRPKAPPAQIQTALERIRTIADDPLYEFGIGMLNHNNKMVTCADLIYYQYRDEGIIEDEATPAIITPDYLFWYAAKHPDKFSFLGARFQK